jgi:hypothetical protein
MTFKKFNGQIFGVELTKKEEKVLHERVNQQIIENHHKFVDDFDYMVMKILHDHFGFGFTRLRRFYDVFNVENDALEKHYEMADAGVYIARKEMNDIGVNIEEWNRERSE